MGYAVELYFDPDSDLAIRRIWSGIADAFGLSTMLTNGGRPHVSLAVYSDDLDHRSFLQELPAFSKSLAPLEVQLGSVGTFSDRRGCRLPGTCSDARVARRSRTVSHSLFRVWRMFLSPLPSRELGTS